jgi:hypothetical protein
VRSGGLEEFDRVAAGVFDQDLFAAGTGDDVVAEGDTGPAEFLDGGRKIGNLEDEAVPTAGSGWGAVGHRATGGTGWAAEPEAEVAAGDDGEGGAHRLFEAEVEDFGVEGGGVGDIIDNVPDLGHEVAFRLVGSGGAQGCEDSTGEESR